MGKGNTEGRLLIMNSTTIAYIAGFLDGDGSIFFQLVRRKDYVFGFQIRCSLAFYQKTENKRILELLKSKFGCGYIRDRKSGISDYTVVEPGEVMKIFKILKPYVVLKRNHILLGMKILKALPFADTPAKFLKLCRLVDTYMSLNYSKKRTITSKVVERYLKAHN